MTETTHVSKTIGRYEDRDRIATILRLFKESHVSEDEALNLIQGDRNYMIGEAIQEIRKVVNPMPSVYGVYGPTSSTTYDSSVSYH